MVAYVAYVSNDDRFQPKLKHAKAELIHNLTGFAVHFLVYANHHFHCI